MGVTFTIQENRKFCAEHELFYKEEFDCDCFYGGKVPSPDCPLCHGKGKVKYNIPKFELNICHGTLIGIGKILGFNFEEYNGEFDPTEFLIELKGIGIEKFVYEFCSVRSCNIDYGILMWRNLQEMCKEAVKRNKKLIWG